GAQVASALTRGRENEGRRRGSVGGLFFRAKRAPGRTRPTDRPRPMDHLWPMDQVRAMDLPRLRLTGAEYHIASMDPKGWIRLNAFPISIRLAPARQIEIEDRTHGEIEVHTVQARLKSRDAPGDRA